MEDKGETQGDDDGRGDETREVEEEEEEEIEVEGREGEKTEDRGERDHV